MNRHTTFIRTPGEAFDGDQVTLPCECCGRSEYSCECDLEDDPTCQCGSPLDAKSYCSDCEEYWPSGWVLAEMAVLSRRAA